METESPGLGWLNGANRYDKKLVKQTLDHPQNLYMDKGGNFDDIRDVVPEF